MRTEPYPRLIDIKRAIEIGDAAALRELLIASPTRANELIHWGERKACFTHPLHFVSDMLFAGRLPKGKEVPLVDALLEAGAAVDFQRSREDGKKGETPSRPGTGTGSSLIPCLALIYRKVLDLPAA